MFACLANKMGGFFIVARVFQPLADTGFALSMPSRRALSRPGVNLEHKHGSLLGTTRWRYEICRPRNPTEGESLRLQKSHDTLA
jgi:hypothetical protein